MKLDAPSCLAGARQRVLHRDRTNTQSVQTWSNLPRVRAWNGERRKQETMQTMDRSCQKNWNLRQLGVDDYLIRCRQWGEDLQWQSFCLGDSGWCLRLHHTSSSDLVNSKSVCDSLLGFNNTLLQLFHDSPIFGWKLKAFGTFVTHGAELDTRIRFPGLGMMLPAMSDIVWPKLPWELKAGPTAIRGCRSSQGDNLQIERPEW